MVPQNASTQVNFEQLLTTPQKSKPFICYKFSNEFVGPADSGRQEPSKPGSRMQLKGGLLAIAEIGGNGKGRRKEMVRGHDIQESRDGESEGDDEGAEGGSYGDDYDDSRSQKRSPGLVKMVLKKFNITLTNLYE